MDLFIVKGEDGSVKVVPLMQLQLNNHQQFMAIGTDFHDRENMRVKGVNPGVTVKLMGKLEDLHTLLEIQVTNSLAKHGWNFQEYPNPEIVLITDSSIIN